MAEPKEQIVRATKGQIVDFKSSILWKDIKRELGLWKTMCRREYSEVVADGISESASSSKILMHLGSLYGREATVDYLLALPDIFIQILEEKDDTEHNTTE